MANWVLSLNIFCCIQFKEIDIIKVFFFHMSFVSTAMRSICNDDCHVVCEVSVMIIIRNGWNKEEKEEYSSYTSTERTGKFLVDI